MTTENNYLTFSLPFVHCPTRLHRLLEASLWGGARGLVLWGQSAGRPAPCPAGSFDIFGFPPVYYTNVCWLLFMIGRPLSLYLPFNNMDRMGPFNERPVGCCEAMYGYDWRDTSRGRIATTSRLAVLGERGTVSRPGPYKRQEPPYT